LSLNKFCSSAINWFEIPVKNFDKARKFYEIILCTDMQLIEAMGMKSAFFPAAMESVGIDGTKWFHGT
jgi:hypothetical protein